MNLYSQFIAVYSYIYMKTIKTLRARKVEFCKFELGGKPLPVAARSKAWVCGRSPAVTVYLSPTGGMDVCLL